MNARVLIGALIVLLAANWVFAVARFQVNTLAWDQWDYSAPLFDSGGWWALWMQQLGPHRHGPALILSSWILAWTHWDERWLSLWIASILVVACVLAVWLKRRISGDRLRARDAWIPFVVLTLGQCHTVINTPNASHSAFPLALLMVAAHAWLSPRPFVRYGLSGVLSFVLTFSGFGIFGSVTLTAMLLVETLRAALRRAWRKAAWPLAGAAIAGAGWVVFFSGYVFDSGASGGKFPWEPMTDYVRVVTLMLAHTAGLHGATPVHYTIGGGLLLIAVAVFAHAFARWMRSRDEAPLEGVLVLLIGSGLLFAVGTALGRVQLGIEAGMVSRYITLLTPIWLGIGLWCEKQPAKIASGPLLAVLFGIGLWPLADLAGRRFSDWPGTVGLTTRRVAEIAEVTELRLRCIETYLRTGDIDAVQREFWPVIHPDPNGTGLLRKLAWLRKRRLSFFNSPQYGPWLPCDRALWLKAYESEGDFQWLGADAHLGGNLTADEFVSFRVLGIAPGLPPDSALRFELDGMPGRIRAEPESAVVSLPVKSGRFDIPLISEAGTWRPEHGDERELSFRVSSPRISSQPIGTPWVLNTTAREWQPELALRMRDGFEGWEGAGNARRAWIGERLVLEVTALRPGWLDVAISERFAPVPRGPVVVTCGEQTWTVRLDEHDRARFSVPIRASDAMQHVEIRNTTGALSPAEVSGSSDTRRLALRVTRLSLDPRPAFEEVREK